MGDKLRTDLTADHAPPKLIAKDTSRSYQHITKAPLLILLCLTMDDMDTTPTPCASSTNGQWPCKAQPWLPKIYSWPPTLSTWELAGCALHSFAPIWSNKPWPCPMIGNRKLCLLLAIRPKRSRRQGSHWLHECCIVSRRPFPPPTSKSDWFNL